MFLVNSVALGVGVVLLAVAGWVVPIIVRAVPRTVGLTKLFENALTGLTVQSVVFGMVFQFVFQGCFIRDLTGVVPDLLGVVVGDVVRLCLTGSQTLSETVPECGCRPRMSV